MRNKIIRNWGQSVTREWICGPLFCLAIGLSASLNTGAGEPTQRYAIAAQSLNNALMEFATQSRVKLIFDADRVRGQSSSGLTGEHTLEQGLARLLEGTGLRHRFVDAGTVTLDRVDPLAALVAEAMKPRHYAGAVQPAPKKPQAPPKKTQEGPTVLPEMTVTATPVDDTGYSARNATTATKTDTPIFDTPVNIQVVPRAVMDDQQVIRLNDALKNVSSFQPGFDFTLSQDHFILRGFEVGEDINALTYRDGVRMSAYSAITAGLERIEVLKGPASVLYGRIEPGGLINLVTKKPLPSPYYALQQTFGSYDLYRTSVDATGPVPIGQPGSLLYRFNVDYLDRDTFRDFVSEEQIYLAPSLTWNIGDRTQVGLAFEYRHQDIPTDSFDYGIPAIGTRPAEISIRRNLGDPTVEFMERDDYIVNLDFSHRFTRDWTLRYKGMFAQEDLVYSVVFPLSLNEATGDLQRGFARHADPADHTTWFTSLEATGHVPLFGMEHTLLVGADYYKDTREDSFDIAIDTIPTINIFNPSYGFVPQIEFPDDPFKETYEWYGVYVQDQIKFLDKWHLLMGARFDHATAATGSGAPGEEIETDTAKPRVGLLYQPWPWLSLYGHYVESLGALSRGRTADMQPLEPETATQYEAGVKAELWEGRLAATLAFYELTKQNIRTPDPANPFFNIAIGEAKSRGIELDITGQVAERLSLIGSYAYTDTEITKDNRPGIEGNRLHSVPRHAGSFWAKYAVTDQFTVGAGIFAAGQREGDDENTFQLPGYVRVDAMASYQWRLWGSRLTAQLNVNNLLDKEYFEAARSRVHILPGAPLTVLGSLRLEY